MANTREEFSKKPWSTDQRFTRNSIEFLNNEVKQAYIKRFNKEQELYIFNVNTLEEVSFKLIPDQMAESYSSKVVSISPFGVITPINFYVGGSSKSISFSFNMHEDLQSIGGSIYNLVTTLENMVKPVFRNNRLYDPHIESSFSYNKPFRNGRFISVDVSMSFTFHEEFDTDPVVLNDTYAQELSPFALDSTITESYVSVDDFIKFQTDPDYFITQVFGNQKFKTYFNAVFTTIEEASIYGDAAARARLGFRNEDESASFNENLQSSTITNLANGQRVEESLYFSNPFSLSLLELFFNLRGVMFTVRDENIGRFLTAYENLKNALNELRRDYNTSYTTKTTGSVASTDIEAGIGWYRQRTKKTSGSVSVEFVVIRMSDAERAAFEELLDYFERILEDQIRFYESLRGAGN